MYMYMQVLRKNRNACNYSNMYSPSHYVEWDTPAIILTIETVCPACEQHCLIGDEGEAFLVHNEPETSV